MSSWLVTGCNRGLGLHLITELLSTPAVSTIVATARSEPTGELQQLLEANKGKLYFTKIDLLSVEDAADAAKRVGEWTGGSLDILVNNAGITRRDPQGIETLTPQGLIDVYATNVAGTHNVTLAFLPLLRKGKDKKIINISSPLGSIALSATNPFPVPAYKISKSGLNALTAEYSHQLGAKEGMTFVALNPGWLKTKLGGPMAPMETSQGAKNCIKVIQDAGHDANGKFISAEDGTTHPW